MDRVDIVKDKLNLLLRENGNRVTCPRNLKRFEDFKNKYCDKPLELVNSKHGLHEKSCAWANDNARCGPDTCHCYGIGREIRFCEKLIDQYYIFFSHGRWDYQDVR